MFRTFLTITLIFLTQIIWGQISGIWHSSSYDVPFIDCSMKLKGNVKTRTMTLSNGKSRTITFNKSGNIITDTYSGTPQTFIPEDFRLIKLKNELEKSISTSEIKYTTCTFNNKMQLVERRAKNNFEKNLFDNDGKILIHQKTSITIEERAYSSLEHSKPFYTDTIKTSILAYFKYNNKGGLTEISYFSSDLHNNLKMVFTYDQDNNIIETKVYDNINIKFNGNIYLDTLMKTAIDTNFSIDDIYPGYWGGGVPVRRIWKYNENGQKIECHIYGLNILSTIVKWEYDDNGKLKQEIQYFHKLNKVSKIIDLEHPYTVIEFDHYGNVIKETDFGIDGTIRNVSEMKIQYFEKSTLEQN